ncbi:hypothetical protein HanIR_Chr17g0892641 [Helianthus annuus]|nr:hypothetical protein HanIR_Chr17g0892641 [Helianthus annuus]
MLTIPVLLTRVYNPSKQPLFLTLASSFIHLLDQSSPPHKISPYNHRHIKYHLNRCKYHNLRYEDVDRQLQK